MTLSKLTEERKRLSDRLALMNVSSTGRDMLIKRLAVIDAEIEQMRKSAS